MGDQTKVNKIQSVSRAVAILRCFEHHRELGLTEISRMLGLHKSTTAGLVSTLRAEGFLEQNPRSGKLRLGLDLFSITVGARMELSKICEPHLNHLMDISGETVNLAVRADTQIMYILKRECERSMRISTRVGGRAPLYCTAIGKAIMSVMPRTEVLAILDRIELVPYTKNTITDIPALLEELDNSKSSGIAYDNEELELGLVCIAAPLTYDADCVGAISVSGPSMRMDKQTKISLAAILLESAEKICAKLSRLSVDI